MTTTDARGRRVTHASGTPWLSLWVVYDHPRDIPGHFVARRFDVHEGDSVATDHVILGATLAKVRDQLPPGLVYMPRYSSDDARIVEIWI